MFIGHWAPALLAAAASKRAPSLAVLFIGGQLVDWAFFGLALGGIERLRFTPGISAMNALDAYHMPYTHSLLGCAVFAAVFGAAVWLGSRDRLAALIAAAVVLSHWLLDLLVHVPDLTWAGQPPKLGLGLWNYPLIEMPLELALTFGTLWLYARARRPVALRVSVMAALLLGLQVFNWFGPVETAVTATSSLLPLAAYGLVTLTAWWMGKSARPVSQAY